MRKKKKKGIRDRNDLHVCLFRFTDWMPQALPFIKLMAFGFVKPFYRKLRQ